MKKTHFTRKNFIALSIIFLFVLFVIVAALGLDATNPVFKKDNPIQKLGLAFGFPYINGSPNAWILLVCFSAYILIYSAAFIYEMRLAYYYEQKIWSKKWTLIYLVTFIITFGIAIGICILSQYPFEGNAITNSFLFLADALVVGFVLFLACFTLIGSIIMLYVNFKNVDRPFRFFGKNFISDYEDNIKRDKEDESLQSEQGTLAESFGSSSSIYNKNTQGVAAVNTIDVSSRLDNEEGINLKKENVFPGLCTLDYILESYRPKKDGFGGSLSDICDNFRNYLAYEHKIYFDIQTIRTFIAALSCSRLIILEGLSGTGKSSLARYFSTYINESSFFEAVQATWRDKTSILGYFNDFQKSYQETEFLKRLYEYTYKKNSINVMVLDEMNISRIEYYFADFLSVLEYPQEEWKLKVMQLPYSFEPPLHLENGILQIPTNTWFIGTANKDDSTYLITDKVYDRAIAINFNNANKEFKPNDNFKPIDITLNDLNMLFENAISNKENRMNEEDYAIFNEINIFVRNKFNISFGNRVLIQIKKFIPTYLACGGTKEEGLDFMFSRKILSKLDGRFEDYINDGLKELRTLLIKKYGREKFDISITSIENMLKRM